MKLTRGILWEKKLILYGSWPYACLGCNINVLREQENNGKATPEREASNHMSSLEPGKDIEWFWHKLGSRIPRVINKLRGIVTVLVSIVLPRTSHRLPTNIKLVAHT